MFHVSLHLMNPKKNEKLDENIIENAIILYFLGMKYVVFYVVVRLCR